MTRRDFLATQIVASASRSGSKLSPPVSVFSKHFHWLSIPEMADAAKDVGFDAIDLTVRKDGHIEPENAAKELPKAVEIIRNKGLDVEMITTGISSVRSPYAEEILKACAASRVSHFRWGGWTYDRSITVESQMAHYRDVAKPLAKLAASNGLTGIYHTHSGIDQFGASIWDIHAVLKDIQPGSLAINYDIGHATIEGGYGGWINSTRLCSSLMKGVAVKDFRWERNDKGQWRPAWKPIGQGMVDFKGFFQLLVKQKFQGPMQIHFEYPMGGADHGHRKITWSREQILSAMKRDLKLLQEYLSI